MLDTGASCSLIDLGSIERLGLQTNIKSSDHRLIDASGNSMSIIGDLDIPITTQGINVIQNMKVVNTKTYQNVILGRDFLAKFSPVEFDFIRNCIKLGDKWYSSVKFHGKERVRLQSKVSLAPVQSV